MSIPEHFKIEGQHIIAGDLLMRLTKKKKESLHHRERSYETLFDKEEDPIGQYLKVTELFSGSWCNSSKSRASVGGIPKKSFILPSRPPKPLPTRTGYLVYGVYSQTVSEVSI